ncbi:hypothetical protein [Photobacterium swingsii]|uniref:hypothetical protein n=1 Tax=Photobacterium swingsii TaxID=680026 RepID=UPI000B247A98|nr:hypothetical protein [Photobacterium swingsii]
MQNVNDTSTELSLADVNAMSKIFGSLFYFPLTHENNQAIITLLKGCDDLEHNALPILFMQSSLTQMMHLTMIFSCCLKAEKPWLRPVGIGLSR